MTLLQESIVDPNYSGPAILEAYFLKRKSEHAFIKGWVKRYFILDLGQGTFSYKSSSFSKIVKLTLPLTSIVKHCPTNGIKSPSGWPYGIELYWMYRSFVLFSNDVGIYNSWIRALGSIKCLCNIKEVNANNESPKIIKRKSNIQLPSQTIKFSKASNSNLFSSCSISTIPKNDISKINSDAHATVKQEEQSKTNAQTEFNQGSHKLNINANETKIESLQSSEKQGTLSGKPIESISHNKAHYIHEAGTQISR